MGRGMDLSQFKEALSSEATVENENLKKELETLKEESSEKIKDLEEELEYVKKQRAHLSNRCYVLTKGMMCLNCNISYPDCKYALTYEDEEAIGRFIRKNHLNRNSVTDHMKVVEFIQKRRANRMKNMEKENGKN